MIIVVKFKLAIQASENLQAADGKANFVFSCGKSVKTTNAATPTFQGADDFKTSTTTERSAKRVRVFAKRRTKNPM